MQASERADGVHPGALRQVIGVGQQHRGAELTELVGRHPLHGAVARDGHEGRRGDLPVRGRQAAESRPRTVGADDLETKAAHVMSIASPKL